MTVHVDSVADIARIAHELQRSRRSATGGEIGSARVATLNLLVYLDDAARYDWILERTLRVAAKHPSRLIVLDASGHTTGVDVATTARQAMGGTVVNERVDVGTGDLDAAAVRSIVQEITVHDVPTILWWTGVSFTGDATFDMLTELATTVLVDSSGSSANEQTIRELADFMASRPRLIMRDLAFMRLAPWQDMIAQFFDDPSLRDDLFSIVDIAIDSGSDAEALYLAGWLGSRLSWEPCDSNTFCARDGHKIPIHRDIRGEQRRVLRVILRSADSVYSAELADDDATVVRLSVEGAKAKPSWLVPLQNIDNTSLIERVILEESSDTIFATSLETVRALLR